MAEISKLSPEKAIEEFHKWVAQIKERAQLEVLAAAVRKRLDEIEKEELLDAKESIRKILAEKNIKPQQLASLFGIKESAAVKQDVDSEEKENIHGFLFRLRQLAPNGLSNPNAISSDPKNWGGEGVKRWVTPNWLREEILNARNEKGRIPEQKLVAIVERYIKIP
ncbi:MAG: hypothetical protein HQL51_05345 [Magnetococcales bacterium]|nr:hypothetical protein [Magnetococcales bacterium]